MSKEDFIIELRGYVTEKEIEQYNDSLPSEETMNAYLENYKNYHMVQDHGIATIVSIHNIGTAKATDISVTIEFPDEIKVFSMKDVRNMKEPEAPKKPQNLMNVAYRRAHMLEYAIENMYSQYEFGETLPQLDFSSIYALSNGNSIYESVEILDNIVEIEQNRGILHTKFDYFNGIYLVPLVRGEFSARVTLMCAEYEDPEELEIIFKCE